MDEGRITYDNPGEAKEFALHMIYCQYVYISFCSIFL